MGYCKLCGEERRKLSARGICKSCKDGIQLEVVSNLKKKQGPYFDKWMDGMFKFFVSQKQRQEESEPGQEIPQPPKTDLQEHHELPPAPDYEPQSPRESELPKLPHYPEEHHG